MCLIYTYMFIFYFCLFGGTGHFSALTHWGRVTHICVSKLNIIASDNGLSPGRRQAIIWTSARILLIGSVGTNFSEILIEIIIFSFKKMRLKVLSAKWRPCCLGLNVLTQICKSRHCDYHCTATTWCWQKHFNWMLATNLSPLCEESSTATISFEVKYSISPLNTRNVDSIISCWLYWVDSKTCNIHCLKFCDDAMVPKQFIFTP